MEQSMKEKRCERKILGFFVVFLCLYSKHRGQWKQPAPRQIAQVLCECLNSTVAWSNERECEERTLCEWATEGITSATALWFFYSSADQTEEIKNWKKKTKKKKKTIKHEPCWPSRVAAKGSPVSDHHLTIGAPHTFFCRQRLAGCATRTLSVRHQLE